MKHYKLLGLAFVVGSLVIAGPAAAQGYGEDQDQNLGQDQDQMNPDQDSDQIQEGEDSNQRVRPGEDQDMDEDQTADPDQVVPPSETTPQSEPETMYSPEMEPAPVAEQNKPQLTTPFGMGLTIGGGVSGFTDGDFNDFAKVGGNWEGRLTVGTQSIIGLEASYVGSANSLDTVGVDNNAYLLSNGFNGAIRLNLTKTAVRPFILAGAGWKHYSVQNTNINTSALQNSDNVAEFPLGAGVNFTYNYFIADVRGVFKPTVDNEMFRSQINNDQTNLDTWQANANIGFEF